MGNIASGIRTGGDTNPELFTAGWEVNVTLPGTQGSVSYNELKVDDGKYEYGTKLPAAMVFVNGGRSAATAWTAVDDGFKISGDFASNAEVSVGYRLHDSTRWNLSDAYYVNNWPGTPYTQHKGNGDSAYHYVTQVNYITGYICAASLH